MAENMANATVRSVSSCLKCGEIFEEIDPTFCSNCGMRTTFEAGHSRLKDELVEEEEKEENLDSLVSSSSSEVDEDINSGSSVLDDDEIRMVVCGAADVIDSSMITDSDALGAREQQAVAVDPRCWEDLFGPKLVPCGGRPTEHHWQPPTVDTRAALSRASHVLLFFIARSFFSCRRYVYALNKLAALRETGGTVVHMMVSADSAQEVFDQSLSDSQVGFAIPFEDLKLRQQLSIRYHVTSLPGMILLDSKGSVMCSDPSWPLLDPVGAYFPWDRTVMQMVSKGGDGAPQIAKVRTTVAFKSKKKDVLSFQKGDVIRVIFIQGLKGRGELAGGKSTGSFSLEHTEPLELVGIDYAKQPAEFVSQVDIQKIEFGLVYLLNDNSFVPMLEKHEKWLVVFQTAEEDSSTRTLLGGLENKKWIELGIACGTVDPHVSLRTSIAFNIEKAPVARLIIGGEGVISVPDKAMANIRALVKFCSKAVDQKSRKMPMAPLPL